MQHNILSTNSSAWSLPGLAAQGPNEAHREKLMLFGQFVGDWNILECKYLESDGTWSKSRGELFWRWILDGKAVQDIWTSIDETSGKSIPAGTTVRFYDPEIDAWRSIWIAPEQPAVKTFIGRKVGDEIVLEGSTPEGVPIKWIFSEIAKDSFRWRGERFRASENNWELYEEMRIQRKA